MAGLDQIKPGQNVTVRIVERPKNAAARKTLIRLLSKDREAQREVERQRKIRKRHLNSQIEDDRLWPNRLVKQQPVTADAGNTGTIRASVDVLRDLNSVQQYVEVSAAS